MPLLIKTPTDWANALLGALGLPDTKNNVDNLIGFWRSEGGGGAGFDPQFRENPDNFNPFNTVLVLPGSHGTNSSGVQSYTSWDEGLDATISELEQSNFSEVLDNLAANAPWNVYAASGDWGNNISGDPMPTTGAVNSKLYDAARQEAKSGVIGNVENPGTTAQSALRAVGDTTGTPTPGGTTGTTSADKPSSNTKTQDFKGFAGILQQLNKWYNPSVAPGGLSLNPLTDVEHLIATPVEGIATLIFVRATSSLLFIGVAGIGLLMLTRGSSGGAGGGDVFEFVQNNENLEAKRQHESAVQQRHERSTYVREQAIIEHRRNRIYTERNRRRRERQKEQA